jgi:hypothetical protein
MTITILRDVLIARNELDRYYEGHVPVNLWRALNMAKGGQLFEFVEEAFMLSNGRPRPADITIESRNGIKWVLVKDRPRGVSTFDKSGVPRGKGWAYFRIPAGTVLPTGLAVVRDEFNTRFEAMHYTIAPASDMPLLEFKKLLDQLAARVTREAI